MVPCGFLFRHCATFLKTSSGAPTSDIPVLFLAKGGFGELGHFEYATLNVYLLVAIGLKEWRQDECYRMVHTKKS